MILREDRTVEILKDGKVLATVSYDKKAGAFKITPNNLERIILSSYDWKEKK